MAIVQNFSDVIKTLNATIASAAMESDVISLLNTSIAGIYIPSAMTSTILTFQASYDGINFFDVQDGAGNQILKTIPASGGAFIPLEPFNFYGIRNLKLLVNLAEASERILVVVPYSI